MAWARSCPEVLELEVCTVPVLAETAMVEAEVPVKKGLEGCSALTELITWLATPSSEEMYWPTGPVLEDMLSSEPSWPPAAEVRVWGQVTLVPLTSGLEASPKLTVTAPLEPVLTEMLARLERSSIAWSRWSISVLGETPACVAWAICWLRVAIVWASWATWPFDPVSDAYCCEA